MSLTLYAENTVIVMLNQVVVLVLVIPTICRTGQVFGGPWWPGFLNHFLLQLPSCKKVSSLIGGEEGKEGEEGEGGVLSPLLLSLRIRGALERLEYLVLFLR